MMKDSLTERVCNGSCWVRRWVSFGGLGGVGTWLATKAQLAYVTSGLVRIGVWFTALGLLHIRVAGRQKPRLSVYARVSLHTCPDYGLGNFDGSKNQAWLVYTNAWIDTQDKETTVGLFVGKDGLCPVGGGAFSHAPLRPEGILVLNRAGDDKDDDTRTGLDKRGCSFRCH
jgi:hypothetical protein